MVADRRSFLELCKKTSRSKKKALQLKTQVQLLQPTEK